MGESILNVDELIQRLAQAETLAGLPPIVNLLDSAPRNPPESIQAAFVGSSYATAYAEAASFVRVADQWTRRHGHARLADASLVIDFGGGWGRISRMLLAHVPPTALYALDVDIQMTALVGTTLPGVQAMTVAPYPPTVLRDAIAEAIVSFSVFTHLEPAAHAAWAREFGRLTKAGKMVFLTLHDVAFFGQVQAAKDAVAAGDRSEFSMALASCFADALEGERRYKRGEPVYAAMGGGGVRSADFYGWAVIPPEFIERAWTEAGFQVVEWVPAGTLFPQAMVGLVKRS